VFKRIAAVCGVVVLIAALRPFYLIGVGLGLWQPLTRPVGVSSRAHYVPTKIDGAWFDCSVDHNRNVDTCRAWDSTGNLIAFGDYRLDGEKRAATALELQPSMVQPYPGHPSLAWIYLFKDNTALGRTLVPVNGDGQPLERFEVHIGGGGH